MNLQADIVALWHKFTNLPLWAQILIAALLALFWWSAAQMQIREDE
jgi:hypothetical protein